MKIFGRKAATDGDGGQETAAVPIGGTEKRLRPGAGGRPRLQAGMRGFLRRDIGYLLLCLLAIACFLYPVKAGGEKSESTFLTGWYTAITDDYCDKTMQKATAAYISAKAASKIIAVFATST